MTFQERTQAVASLGFTDRQARFLVTVMLHSGVCVPRQYARFARIAYGQKTQKFFAKLVRLGYASPHDCRHNRARLYHVHARTLYRAIDDPESRLRRPLTLGHAVLRLMALDAIVEDPDLVWPATAEEKAAHLTTLTRIDPTTLPHVTVGEGDARTIRYFPDRLPIGIDPNGFGVLVYVITDPVLDEFRVFLERHASVVRALPAWTLRIVAPPHFPGVGRLAKQVVWNQLLTPLGPRPRSTNCVGTSSRPDAIPRRLVATSTSGSTVRARDSQRPGSRRCTGCGSRTATWRSPRLDHTSSPLP